MRSDCITCHQSDFSHDASEAHSGPGLDSCGNCHRVAAWQPALRNLHPEALFSVASSPHDYGCLECHNLDRGAEAKDGANADCTGCHEGAHTEEAALRRHRRVQGFSFDRSNPAFCRGCHARGRNDPDDYPDDVVINTSIP